MKKMHKENNKENVAEKTIRGSLEENFKDDL